uniref:Cyclin-dependent kinase inhibitor domain-containing protein n=1 Tax=Oryza meridionalis TaxID=40149 RepID=A0A0E0E4Y9_9ORYZ
MAAAAAAVTAVQPAASSCGKRDGDNACVVDMPRKAKKGRSPPEEEVEAFLAAAESSVARRFAAKYNYDIVKDAPMDGRYEWVRIPAFFAVANDEANLCVEAFRCMWTC